MSRPSRPARLLALGLAAAWCAAPLPARGAGESGPGAAEAARPAPARGTASPRDPAYRLGPDDVLRIAVFGEPDLSGEFAVGADGRIGFPLLGQVPAAGRTTEELRGELARLLERDYLYAANVSVAVKEHRSRKVRILGSVARPGTYYLSGPTRLLDLLSQAGGVSPQLGEVRRGQTVRVTREAPGNGAAAGAAPAGDAAAGSAPGGAGEPVRVEVDLHDLLVSGDDAANVEIEAGDIVYVPTSETIYVVGEVRTPGSYPYEAGMTVLKAVTLAGGPTKKGAPRGSVVKRIEDGREVRVRVSMEDPVRPGDILEVPLSFW